MESTYHTAIGKTPAQNPPSVTTTSPKTSSVLPVVPEEEKPQTPAEKRATTGDDQATQEISTEIEETFEPVGEKVEDISPVKKPSSTAEASKLAKPHVRPRQNRKEPPAGEEPKTEPSVSDSKADGSVSEFDAQLQQEADRKAAIIARLQKRGAVDLSAPPNPTAAQQSKVTTEKTKKSDVSDAEKDPPISPKPQPAPRRDFAAQPGSPEGAPVPAPRTLKVPELDKILDTDPRTLQEAAKELNTPSAPPQVSEEPLKHAESDDKTLAVSEQSTQELADGQPADDTSEEASSDSEDEGSVTLDSYKKTVEVVHCGTEPFSDSLDAQSSDRQPEETHEVVFVNGATTDNLSGEGQDIPSASLQAKAETTVVETAGGAETTKSENTADNKEEAVIVVDTPTSSTGEVFSEANPVVDTQATDTFTSDTQFNSDSPSGGGEVKQETTAEFTPDSLSGGAEATQETTADPTPAAAADPVTPVVADQSAAV